MIKTSAVIINLLFLLITTSVIAQTEVKVMSYNIRLNVESDGENKWALRKDRVAGLIKYHEPDFVGGQEVTHGQLVDLNQRMPDYNYIGVGRDDGKEKGEYSCIWYKKERYQLLQQSTFWLSPTPNSITKGWDAAIVRVCTYGLFKDKKTKKKFWVFNTHFDHIGKTARLESSKLIVEQINKLNTKNFPVILTGDFNSRPEEAPAQFIMSNMQNARTISSMVYGDAPTFNAFRFKEKLENCIDYIFVNNHKSISVSKFATITDSYDLKYPSDHLPVMATIIIKK
jgi:endonuclease/exonuclease/phosphatase family metal-dependent hydrolase